MYFSIVQVKLYRKGVDIKDASVSAFITAAAQKGLSFL
jgi:hypothetical protein